MSLPKINSVNGNWKEPKLKGKGINIIPNAANKAITFFETEKLFIIPHGVNYRNTKLPFDLVV